MQYLIGIAVILALLFFFGCTKLRGSTGGTDGRPGITTNAGNQGGEVVATTQRDELAQRLRELASSDPPTELAPGAMCYEPMPPIESAEYVCPTCGERTRYETDHVYFVQDSIPEARRFLEEIEGLKVELDETEFCRSCSPDEESPVLSLAISFEGEDEPVRVPGVTPNDLDLLAEFMRGETKHTDAQDFESPLKDHVDRLAELLSIDLSPAEAEATREQVRARLAALASSDAPTELAPGALCYEMAAPMERVEFVCPDCGERTLYEDGFGFWAALEIDEARRIVDGIDAVDAELDESGFCAQCRPGAAGPKLGLIVRYKGEARTHTSHGVTVAQLAILADFLAGKDRHKNEVDMESAMKDHLEMLERLLGIDIDDG